MSKEYKRFLTNLKFKEIKSDRYPYHGRTFKVDTNQLQGFYWFYDTEYFRVNIHDFTALEDLHLNLGEQVEDGLITISMMMSISGENLEPSLKLTGNNIYSTYHKNSKPNYFILHKSVPMFSVGFEYKEKYWKEEVPKKYSIPEKVIFEAVKNFSFKGSNLKIEKIANEILNSRNKNPAYKLFYESLAQELLYIVLHNYFEKQRHSMHKTDEEAINTVRDYLDDNYKSEIRLDYLCEIALMGRTKLKESFKNQFGMTTIHYLQLKRMNEAEKLILNTDLKISDIAKSVGYSSASRFSELFKRYKGKTPTEFRNDVEPF